MTISYAIPVCNEFLEIQKLLSFLVAHKRNEDEIVILFDSQNGSPSIESYLRAQSVNNPKFRWHSYKFDGHFANMKNHLTHLCKCDYVFQIDADEMPTEYMMQIIPQILEANPVDLIRVARINIVEGLTEGHIKKWGWNVNDKQWVNYPDYQTRIYKNDSSIKWGGNVHEKIMGHSTFSHLPAEETELALLHHKTIKRQEKQNEYYAQL
jgi:hypothetical protein